jgi:hypothetical protein
LPGTLSSYFNTIVVAEWITFIAACLLLDRKTGHWQLFIALLALILLTETSGWYLFSYAGRQYNALPFNLLLITGSLFQLWFLSKPLSPKQRKAAFYARLTFLAFAMINLLLWQKWQQYNSYTESLADILLALCCCLLFIRLLNDPGSVNVLVNEYFWLAAGVLISALGSAVLYLFQSTLYQYYLQTKLNIGWYILIGFNLIYYSSLILAFICRRKTTRQLSVSLSS